MTKDKKIKILTEALKSIACVHLPKANTPEFWIGKTMFDCAEILSEDTDIARHALSEAGIK